jgi:hypothetical protein
MSVIANLLALVNWNVRRRTHSYGGNNSASTESESDQEDNGHPEFGLEFIADRAANHDGHMMLPPDNETQFLDYMRDHQDDPRVETYPTVFQDGLVFTDGTPGGWIIADDDAYIDWREL